MEPGKTTPTLQQRFARACAAKRQELLGLLDTGDVAPAGIARLLRDLVGDASVLGLDKLAAAGSRLEELVKRQGALSDPASRTQVRTWAGRLCELGEHLDAADTALPWVEVQELLTELEGALRAPVASTGKRLLVLDDSAIVREALGIELQARGYSVALAADPEEFFGALSSHKPQVVIVDYNMPEMSGDQVCRRVRALPESREASVILLSTIPEGELAVLAKEAGADGFCSKQAGIEPLLRYVESLAQKRQPTIAMQFGDRAHAHKLRIEELLTASTLDERRIVDTLSVCVRDCVAEARLLGIEPVAAAGESLLAMLEDRASRPAIAARLADWAMRLFDAACALAVGRSGDAADSALAELRDEIARVPARRAKNTCQVRCAPRRILILDDSPVIGDAIAIELQERGHPVASVSTLAEFEQRLLDFAPQVILLDVNMPELSGDELCRRLRARFADRGVSIFLVSAVPEEKLAALAAEADADGYLSKAGGLEAIVEGVDVLTPRALFLF